MRKIWISVGGLVLTLAAAAAALFLLVDVNQFRPTIQAELQKRLHRDVTLGAMGLSLIPLSVRADDVTIGESAAFKSKSPFVTIKSLYVRVGLAALLRKQIQVDALSLKQPDVELIRAPGGGWNTADLGGPAGPPDSKAGGGGGPQAFSLSDLRIDDGRLAVTDGMHGNTRSVYDHIDVKLSGYAPGRPFRLEAKLRTPKGDIAAEAAGAFNETNGVLSLSSVKVSTGGVTATGQGEVRTKSTPAIIDAELRTDNAALGDLLRLADAGVSGTGTLSLDLKVRGPASAPALDGSGSVRNASLTMPSLRKPLEVRSAAIKLTQERVDLHDVDASLGSTHVRGMVGVANFAQPRLDFRADADRVDVGELQQLTVPSSGSKRRAGGSQSSLTGAGSITAGTLSYDRLTLTDVKANCRLDSSAIRLDPVSAKLFGGQTQGTIVVNTRPDTTGYGVQVKLASIDANQLVSAMTPAHQVLFGSLSGASDLQLAPKPGQDIARGLNGTVQFQLTDGKLAGVQLLNELASLGKFLGYAKRSETFTSIVKLAGTLKIQDGVANTDDLALAFNGGSLTGAGAMNLTDQSLKMRLTAVLGKEISQSAGGSRVGGWMSTVLANPKGEFVIPAIVSGTLSQPRFAPDPERLAKFKLAGLLPSTQNPNAIGGGFKGIVDAITGKQPTEGAAQQGTQQGGQPQPADAIRDIFKALGKKKQ